SIALRGEAFSRSRTASASSYAAALYRSRAVAIESRGPAPAAVADTVTPRLMATAAVHRRLRRAAIETLLPGCLVRLTWHVREPCRGERLRNDSCYAISKRQKRTAGAQPIRRSGPGARGFHRKHVVRNRIL